MERAALFLDRDGTINKMVFYPQTNEYDSPQKPEDVKIINGIIQLIKWANQRNIPVLEVSNQPGKAQGKMTMESCQAIEQKVHKLLLENGAVIDKAYTCLHHPHGIVPELTTKCDCRKPKPGLLTQAAAEFKIDLASSVIIGDQASDIEAGRAVGCKTILLLHQENTSKKIQAANAAIADYKIESVSEAIPILEQLFI